MPSTVPRSSKGRRPQGVEHRQGATTRSLLPTPLHQTGPRRGHLPRVCTTKGAASRKAVTAQSMTSTTTIAWLSSSTQRTWRRRDVRRSRRTPSSRRRSHRGRRAPACSRRRGTRGTCATSSCQRTSRGMSASCCAETMAGPCVNSMLHSSRTGAPSTELAPLSASSALACCARLPIRRSLCRACDRTFWRLGRGRFWLSWPPRAW
mmetsp:Transcript_14736/g.57798  ORF Transcript_14736/g.57798 Transcript_14736/m.57798 type:complete len:206 (+) Transcript_14736:611-1228(+)